MLEKLLKDLLKYICKKKMTSHLYLMNMTTSQKHDHLKMVLMNMSGRGRPPTKYLKIVQYLHDNSIISMFQDESVYYMLPEIRRYISNIEDAGLVNEIFFSMFDLTIFD